MSILYPSPNSGRSRPHSRSKSRHKRRKKKSVDFEEENDKIALERYRMQQESKGLVPRLKQLQQLQLTIKQENQKLKIKEQRLDAKLADLTLRERQHSRNLELLEKQRSSLSQDRQQFELEKQYAKEDLLRQTDSITKREIDLKHAEQRFDRLTKDFRKEMDHDRTALMSEHRLRRSQLEDDIAKRRSELDDQALRLEEDKEKNHFEFINSLEKLDAMKKELDLSSNQLRLKQQTLDQREEAQDCREREIKSFLETSMDTINKQRSDILSRESQVTLFESKLAELRKTAHLFD
mmetsp:Transcript_4960/g.7350  ORF Transcript_4960/g.7350 Transcript_4960/m.7350 type:complete len:293 (+) Transcript_4960:121-999(+)